ncbi:MAG: NADH-quinone oxidoreductase subunit NuoF [Candidatus Eiseniibacteriota bacterium]|jgi:NADH-quinone oxidoreductase subunit F
MERPLTRDIPPDGRPLRLRGYERAGGYGALRKALREMAPGEITEQVKDANLRGRGGAGFNTGMKWGFVPTGDDAPRPRYLVANADEMEPGTFKDRYLMEGNPHLLIEGIVLSAYAIGAEVAFIFLRWAYRRAEERLRQAIAEAREAGYLGQRIAGSDFDLALHLHVSAGRYMCGEETGLLNALEGRRATPRAKPPFPQVSGLWGKPTIVQNVETLCNVPGIVEHGAVWYRDLSHGDDGGTKLYGASGKVRRPGLWELPMGTSLREILEEHAGGMRDGLRFRGALPGGGSTDFLVEKHLDVAMDFDSVKQAGSRLGTGTVIVLDDQTCPVAMVLNLQRFFAQESCGWCTPCRDGLPWVARTLEAIDDGEGCFEDLERLEQQVRFLGPGNTFCALAPGAAEPLGSALEHFRDDFERHVREGCCPWRSGG